MLAIANLNTKLHESKTVEFEWLYLKKHKSTPKKYLEKIELSNFTSDCTTKTEAKLPNESGVKDFCKRFSLAQNKLLSYSYLTEDKLEALKQLWCSNYW